MISAQRRTPVILQMEAAECGAACLAMVLGAHGHAITLEEARVACATARDGVDAARLVMAAQSYGLKARGLRREPEELASLPMPLILHWNFDHFVVLEGVRGGRFLINDPAKGRRNLDRAGFGRSFTGIVLAFEPGPDFTTKTPQRSILSRLTAEAAQSPDAMILTLLLGVAGILPALALTGAIGVFTDHVVGQAREGWVVFIIVALVAAVAMQGLLSTLNGWLVAGLQAKIATHVAVGGFWSALFLPTAFFAQRSAGEVVSRLRLGSDVGRVVAGPLAGILPHIVVTAGYLAILAFHAFPIAVAVGCIAAVNLLLMAVLSRRVSEANAAFQIADGLAAGASTAGLASLEIYRLHGRETLLVDRVATAEDMALDREQRLGVLRAIGSAAPAASAALLTSIVLCFGAVLVMDGTLTLGGLVACQAIAGLLNGPLVALAAALPQMQEASGAFARIEDLRRYPVAKAFDPTRTIAAPPPRKGRVALDGVSFGFSPGQVLLRDIHIQIEPGRLVALMGASGAGKSTLARLIAGMIEANEGSVALDGVDIQSWPQDALRHALLYVPQESTAFSGTIDENITMWDEAITQANIAAAISQAGLDTIVARRPGGTHARLAGHAPGLSGGELQRLALARALARKPSVFVLDETTSALDLASEAAILKQLRASGSTVILVTHRASAALACDELIYLDGGAIVGRGAPSAFFPHLVADKTVPQAPSLRAAPEAA